MNGTIENQNRLSREGGRISRNYITPAANILANPNEYVVELEMPGVNKEGIEIVAEGGGLTVTGRRQSNLAEGELLYYESSPADFRRTFQLSPDVDTAKIAAEMNQGVLKLHLPKREDFKPRKIPISG